MIPEHVDNRVVGAIRWVDSITKSTITRPLVTKSPTALLVRNLSGLSIIKTAIGLEKYHHAFALESLRPEDVKTDESVEVTGEVRDPGDSYLPRAFTIMVPRPAKPDQPLPANSLFKPVEIQLLPGRQARTMAGWTQVRVTVKNPAGELLPNVLVRVVATSGNGGVLGRGMSDKRGEALVIVPNLPLFQAGATSAVLVTSEVAARIEFIPPAAGGNASVVDWTALDALNATAANTGTKPLALKAGAAYSLQFTVSP